MSALSTMSLSAVFRVSPRLQVTVRCTYTKNPRDLATPALPHSDTRSQGPSGPASPSSSPSWTEPDAEASSWSSNPVVQLLKGQKKNVAVATLAYLTLANGRKDGKATRAEAVMDAMTHNSKLQLVVDEGAVN